MAYDARVFRILVASPSDVAQEREILARAIQEWNDLNSLEKRVVLLPLLWETHSSPEMGDRPQAIINRQLVDSCDMLVGAFWTKLGTPTGKAASGTIEEIERVGNAGKLVMLYFSKVKVQIDSVDLVQYQKLKEFKQRTYPKGLVESYSSLLEFKDKFSKQLAMKARELVSRDAESRGDRAHPLPDTDRPKLEMALVEIATERMHRSGSNLDVEVVTCIDIDKIGEALEEDQPASPNTENPEVSSEEDAYAESRVRYLKKLVEHYCLQKSLQSYRLAVSNEGDLGVRDVILEIALGNQDENLYLFPDDSPPARPRKPRKPHAEASYVISAGQDVYINNIYGADTRDILIEDSGDGWNLRFTVPVVQPRRTVVSNERFSLGAKIDCEAEFEATVFSSQSTPFKLKASFRFDVSFKEMTYRQILEEMGEDLEVDFSGSS